MAVVTKLNPNYVLAQKARVRRYKALLIFHQIRQKIPQGCILTMTLQYF